MQLLVNKQYCPYCGEPIEIVIDDSVEQQQYVEDCSVCCRPMVVSIRINPFAGEPEVLIATENDSMASW